MKYYLEHILRSAVMQWRRDATSQRDSAQFRRITMSNRTRATALTNRPARRQVLAGAAMAVGAFVVGPIDARAGADDADTDSGPKLPLDLRGFPDACGQSLLDGWNKNYWHPLEKFPAQP